MSTSNNTPKALYDLIAKTGDYITLLGNVTSFGDSPSINDDLGLIAFIGHSNNHNDLLVENGWDRLPIFLIPILIALVKPYRSITKIR